MEKKIINKIYQKTRSVYIWGFFFFFFSKNGIYLIILKGKLKERENLFFPTKIDYFDDKKISKLIGLH